MIFGLLFAGALDNRAANDPELNNAQRIRIVFIGGLIWLPLIIFSIGSLLFKEKKHDGKE
jgi:hypothetical protein